MIVGVKKRARTFAMHFGFWLMGVRGNREPTFGWGQLIYEWGSYYTGTEPK